MGQDNVPGAFTKESYCIEQQKTQDDLIKFVTYVYDTSKDVTERTDALEEIAYARDLAGSRYVKNYVGTDDDTSHSSGKSTVTGCRLIRSGMFDKKLRKAASILTDRKPKTYVKAQKIEVRDKGSTIEEKLAPLGGVPGFVRLLEGIKNEWWDKIDFDSIIYNLAYGGLRDGLAIPLVYWDEKFGKHGDPRVKLVKPENFIPEAGVSDISEMAQWFIVKRLDYKRAIKQYGEKAIEDLTSSATVDDNTENVEDTNKSRGDFASSDITVIDSLWKDESCEYWLDNTDEMTGVMDSKKISEQQYWKLYDGFLEQNIDPETAGLRKIELYPHGRLISFSQNKILRDIPNNTQFCPIDAWGPFNDPYSFYGKPIVRDLSSPIENVDKILQFATENLYLTGNSWVLMPPNCLENEDELTNKVAAVLHGAENSNRSFKDFGYSHQGTVIAEDAYRLYSILVNMIDDLSGVSDASEGQSPSARSGRTVIALQESTNQFFRAPGRTLEHMIKNIMTKVLTLMLEHYSENREYKNDQGAMSVIPFDLSEIEATIDLEVGSGSTLPRDPESVLNSLMSYAQMFPQAVGPEMIAKEMGLENEISDPQTKLNIMMAEAQSKIQQTGGDPAKMQQLMQSGQIPQQIFQLLMNDLQKQQQGNPMAQAAPEGANQPVL